MPPDNGGHLPQGGARQEEEGRTEEVTELVFFLVFFIEKTSIFGG